MVFLWIANKICAGGGGGGGNESVSLIKWKRLVSAVIDDIQNS